MHDLVTGAKTAREAREYYMKSLRFMAQGPAGDRDMRTISDDELKRAAAEAKAHA